MNTLTPVGHLMYTLWPRASLPRSGDETLVQHIQETAATYRQLPNHALKDRVDLLREQRQPPASSHRGVVIPAFALLYEALRRALGVCSYDVQLLAGVALARETIAEMQTGEGKTFAAALPATLHAIAGRGAHAMTVNTYLAQRDHELLRPAYALLGLSSAVLARDASSREKRAAYAQDITYGPAYEFGFDYLRDQLSLLERRRRRLGESYRGLLRGQRETLATPVQRGRHFAIVDEADSVMLDEANTPLILSGRVSQAAPNPNVYLVAKQVADRLEPDQDYVFDARTRTVHLTERGARVIRADFSRIPTEGLRRPWND